VLRFVIFLTWTNFTWRICPIQCCFVNYLCQKLLNWDLDEMLKHISTIFFDPTSIFYFSSSYNYLDCEDQYDCEIDFEIKENYCVVWIFLNSKLFDIYLVRGQIKLNPMFFVQVIREYMLSIALLQLFWKLKWM